MKDSLEALGVLRPARTIKHERHSARLLLVAVARLVRDSTDPLDALDDLADALPRLVLVCGIQTDVWAPARNALVAIVELCNILNTSFETLLQNMLAHNQFEGLDRAQLLATCFFHGNTQQVSNQLDADMIDVARETIEESTGGALAGELLSLLAVLVHPRAHSTAVLTQHNIV